MFELLPPGPCYYCLISPEGTLVLPFRWNGDRRRAFQQYHQIQMLDEAGDPIPQPYPDPEDFDPEQRGVATDWLIDLLHPPDGWTVEILTPEQFAETQVAPDMKKFDRVTRTIHLRPEVEELPMKFGRQQLQWKNAEDIELGHRIFGGAPCFKIKTASPKTEKDFPELFFTHRSVDRKDSIKPVEREVAQQRKAGIVTRAALSTRGRGQRS